VTERVLGERLAEMIAETEAENVRAIAAGQAHGNYGEDFGALLLDLRDARAEIALLTDVGMKLGIEIAELKAEIVRLREMVEKEVDHQHERQDHFALVLKRWTAERRALVERAVRAGWDGRGAEKRLQAWQHPPGDETCTDIAARVLAEHEAEKEKP
jgi:hypothetical protein